MSKKVELDQVALAAEMRDLAQSAILAWFADLLRVRLATQSSAQRAMTLAMLQSGLDDVLKNHASQNVSPVTDSSTQRASLFKASYAELSAKLMTTMGSGLTEAESQAMKPAN